MDCNYCVRRMGRYVPLSFLGQETRGCGPSETKPLDLSLELPSINGSGCSLPPSAEDAADGLSPNTDGAGDGWGVEPSTGVEGSSSGSSGSTASNSCVSSSSASRFSEK